MNSKSHFLSLAFAFSALLPVACGLHAADDSFKAPDTIVLKNGKVVHGVILRNTNKELLLQEEFAETAIPKSEILRIDDAPNTNNEFTGIFKTGTLPAWRLIANDLRTIDQIRTMQEIPATAIDNGKFKNVPYMSFRLNGFVEVNIYGDPNHPAGFEMGIYGHRSGDKNLRDVIRAYLAGYLTSRAEIAALYSIPMTGGIKTADGLTIEITPTTGADAYGAWWISLYNQKLLKQSRLSDTNYAKLTRPFDEVVGKNGLVTDNTWTEEEAHITERTRDLGPKGKVILRGFYRDKDGTFRLVTEAAPHSAPGSGATKTE